MMETIGFIGSILLAVCGIPEVVRTIKDNKCHLGWNFLLLWFGGELFMLTYIIPMKDLPLLLNYVFNTALVAIMLFYKIKNTKYVTIKRSNRRETFVGGKDAI
jgi:uncharacterized protein with PQ loop repeat